MQGERHVLLLVEGNTTRGALQWALGVAVRPQDHLHVFTVGRPTAKLVGCVWLGTWDIMESVLHKWYLCWCNASWGHCGLYFCRSVWHSRLHTTAWVGLLSCFGGFRAIPFLWQPVTSSLQSRW